MRYHQKNTGAHDYEEDDEDSEVRVRMDELDERFFRFGLSYIQSFSERPSLYCFQIFDHFSIVSPPLVVMNTRIS